MGYWSSGTANLSFPDSPEYISGAVLFCFVRSALNGRLKISIARRFRTSSVHAGIVLPASRYRFYFSRSCCTTRPFWNWTADFFVLERRIGCQTVAPAKYASEECYECCPESVRYYSDMAISALPNVNRFNFRESARKASDFHNGAPSTNKLFPSWMRFLVNLFFITRSRSIKDALMWLSERNQVRKHTSILTSKGVRLVLKR